MYYISIFTCILKYCILIHINMYEIPLWCMGPFLTNLTAALNRCYIAIYEN